MSELAEIQRTLGRIEAQQTAIFEDVREVKATFGAEITGVKTKADSLEKRVRSLEGWQRYILGGAAVLGAVASVAFAFL